LLSNITHYKTLIKLIKHQNKLIKKLPKIPKLKLLTVNLNFQKNKSEKKLGTCTINIKKRGAR
jgi:hypothetical protein